MIRHSCAAVAVALLMAAPAAAQTVAGDFAALPRGVATVYLVDNEGNETKGDLLRVAAESLMLATDRGTVSFKREQIHRVYRRGDTLKNGMRNGMLTGLGIGVVVGFATPMSGCDGFDAVSGACAAVGKGLLTTITAPGFAGLGMAIGAGIDALQRGRTLIYERPSRASVSIAPAVSPHSTGIALSIAW